MEKSAGSAFPLGALAAPVLYTYLRRALEWDVSSLGRFTINEIWVRLRFCHQWRWAYSKFSRVRRLVYKPPEWCVKKDTILGEGRVQISIGVKSATNGHFRRHPFFKIACSAGRYERLSQRTLLARWWNERNKLLTILSHLASRSWRRFFWLYVALGGRCSWDTFLLLEAIYGERNFEMFLFSSPLTDFQRAPRASKCLWIALFGVVGK